MQDGPWRAIAQICARLAASASFAPSPSVFLRRRTFGQCFVAPIECGARLPRFGQLPERPRPFGVRRESWSGASLFVPVSWPF